MIPKRGKHIHFGRTDNLSKGSVSEVGETVLGELPCKELLKAESKGEEGKGREDMKGWLVWWEALECRLSLYSVEKAMGRQGQILDRKETC